MGCWYCHAIISIIRSAIHTAFYPNVQAVVKSIFPGNLGLQSKFMTHAMQCVKPGIDYFCQHQGMIWGCQWHHSKQRGFFPCQAVWNAADIDCLWVFPFLVPSIVLLQAELPTYLAKVAEVESCRCWKNNSNSLPTWPSAAAKVLLLQPSSATSERVFSLLKHSFSSQQHNAL